MKIRQGFVSNSSSTSFMIYGASLEFNFDKLLKAKLVTEGQKDDVENDPSGLAYAVQKKLPSGFKFFWDYGSEEMYIGRDPKSIGNYETGLEFQTAVEEKVTELFGKQKFRWIMETIDT